MTLPRIQSLLRYDWTLEKRDFSLTLAVFTIIYICMVLLFFMYNGLFGLDMSQYEGLPLSTSIFCAQFFNYAYVIMGLVVTQVLHRKFTNPRTSLSYLTLPGTNAEKWLVMILDYIIAFVAVFALQAVMYELSSFVGYCFAPALNWDFNPFKYLGLVPVDQLKEMMVEAGDLQNASEEGAQIVGQIIDKVIGPMLLMTPFVSLFQWGIYIVLNMCFRTHGQLKSIACLFGFGAVMGIIGSIVMFKALVAGIDGTGDMSPTIVMDLIMGEGFSMFNCMKWYYYSSPFLCAAVYYLFYKQIGWKQAK